jgi:hypothetical protein
MEDPRSRLFHQYWLALRICLWMLELPVQLRVYSLPALLRRMSRQEPACTPMDSRQAAAVVVRVCRLRLFHGRWFPRACLQQALMLYRVLNGLGSPVTIHFGVQKNGSILRGHSWITFEGRLVAEPASVREFVAVYTYRCSRVLHS